MELKSLKALISFHFPKGDIGLRLSSTFLSTPKALSSEAEPWLEVGYPKPTEDALTRFPLGAEKTIGRYPVSAGVVLSLVMGSGAVLMEERLAGILNNVHTPTSISTIYSSQPSSLQATLTGDNSRTSSLCCVGISSMAIEAG